MRNLFPDNMIPYQNDVTIIGSARKQNCTTFMTRVITLLCVLFMAVFYCNAQPNLVFYHTHQQANASTYNPAFLTAQEKFTFSIFPVAGMSVGYNNQAVIKEMLLEFVSGNQNTDDFKDVFNSLLKRDLFYQRMEFPVLSFGYNSEWGSFNFRIREVEQLMSDFKSNFSEFLSNPDYQTMTLNYFQLLPATASYYREYSLGYGKEMIKKKLDVGFRIKFYFGKANLISDVSGGIVKGIDDFVLNTKGSAKISVPFKLILDHDSVLTSAAMADDFTVMKYVFNSGNPGFGIDLGFNYRINPQLELSASITDWGSILWNRYINTMHFNGRYTFPDHYIESAGDNYITKTSEFSTKDEDINLSGLFKIRQDQSEYSMQMPANFYLGLRYQLNSRTSLGAVSRHVAAKRMNYNSTSLTVNYQVNPKLSLSSGYAVLGNSFANIPFGLLYQKERVQSFIGTDNLLSFLIPSATEFAGITFGTSFILFKHSSKYKKQLEYRPYFKEKKTRQNSGRGLIFNEY